MSWIRATLFCLAWVALGSWALAEDLPKVLSVSGKRGSDGSAGRSGRSSGGSGSDAGSSTTGAHAGALELLIETATAENGEETPARFRIHGSRVSSRAQGASVPGSQPLDRTFSMGETGLLGLAAVGGAGGHGGDGGRGAQGATGSSGRNASCSSSGGRGGNGGRGGDGGDGTSGSAGGEGGSVRLAVAPRDTHLLLLVEAAVNGGKGGAPGSHGRGGAGGSGGRGGRRHSSHGSKDNRCSGRSGGSRGSSGARGSSGSGSLARGANGKDGSFEILVDGTSYSGRYRLELESYRLVSANGDGIFEPGEWAIVDRMHMRNDGALPVPAQSLHPSKVFLPLTRNVSEPSEPLVLPGSLAAAQALTHSGALRFRVPDVNTDDVVMANRRYADTGAVEPHARLDRAHREYPEFPRKTPFAVSFPLTVRQPRLTSAFSAGETYRFFLNAENLSSLGYGASATGGTPRTVRVSLRLEEGTLTSRDLVLDIGDGRVHDLSKGPFSWEIDRLAAKGKVRRELTLGIRSEAIPYVGGTLAVDLHFGRLGESGAERVVERRRLPLRVAARWKAPTRPALVLVTNTSVEQEAVQGWKALASSLDLELAIWDLSYYGFLPLGTAFSDRSDAHFAADPNVHAVVLLGGAFTAPLEDADGRRLQVRSAMFLDEDGLLRATAHAGLGVLMVGGSEPMSADAGGQGDLLAGATSGFAGRDHDSPAAFLDWLDEQDATRADLGSVHSVAVGEVPWHSDAQLYPAEVGLALLEDLRKRWPSRRYRTLVHEGRIVVELLEDLERARLVYVRSTDEELRLKTTATAPHVLGSLVGSLRFERKLALLQRFLEGDLPLGELSPETLGNAIAEAVVRDLKNEADVWQREAGSGFDTAGTYRERMRLHHALGTLKLKAPVEVVGPRGRCALRILSAIKACGSRWGASDVLIPFAARRYLVAAAIAGTRTQSGLADEFGEGVFGSEFDVSEHVAPEPAAAYWSRTFTPGAGLFLVAGELEAKRAPVREGARARAAYLAGHERMLSESFMAEELDAGQ